MSQINLADLLQRAADHHRAGQLAEAEALYRQVLARDANQPDALHLLGVLAYQVKRPDVATGLIRQAIMLRPQWPEAHNHLGNALKEQGKFDEAIAAYNKALSLRGNFAEAHLNMGNALLQKGEWQEAINSYQQALAQRPDYADAHNNLGNAYKGQAWLEEAITSYRQAQRLQPRNVEVLSNLGNALRENGQMEEAMGCYQQALAIQPDHAPTLINLGNALRIKGNLDAALSCYLQAQKIAPEMPEAYYNLGNIDKERGRFEEAVAAYRQALALRPGYLDALLAMGTAQAHGRHFAEAVATLQAALQIRPDHPEALLNLGNALHETKEDQKAMAAYERALALRPDYPEVLLNIGNMQKERGELELSVRTHQRVLSLRPDYAEAYLNLGNTMKSMGRMAEAIDFYRQALAQRPQYMDAHSNLLFALHDLSETTPEALFAEARQWNETHAGNLPRAPRPHANDKSPQRRIRVGYVSADFRTHSCAFFSAPLFSHHDHAAVEVFCYAQVTRPDEITKQLQAYADHWISTLGMSDEAMAERIRADQIDILVDMMGHTADHRLRVFARGPAPIQVNYLGYPDTTGLGAMDYRLTDAFADPVGMTEGLHTEKLVRLPESFLCYQPPEPPLEILAPPVTRGAALTFGSFNDVGKVSNATVGMWVEILQRLPNARLLLKTRNLGYQATRDYLLERFRERGIGAERLDLRGMTPSVAEHLALYNEVDVALDPYPYHGTTTTCEALWMGVPVITLAGRAHASRVGVSLLCNVGLPELVADSPQEYVEKAVGLASHVGRLSEVRQTLRPRMKASSLMNAPRLTRHLEAAYRDMWQKWCAQQTSQVR